MATKEILDYRRMDERRYDHLTPRWISSAELSGPDADDLCALLFSFPAAKYGSADLLIEKICFEVTEAFAGGTITVNVGSHTIATDLITTGGDATLVDVDDYIPTADITSGTPGVYFAATGDWITAKLLMTELTPVIIVPADTTVPCIAVEVASDATITAGKGRVHVMITEVPRVT